MEPPSAGAQPLPPPSLDPIDDPTSSVWDFADLLDFTSDDPHLLLDPWDLPADSAAALPPSTTADPDPLPIPPPSLPPTDTSPSRTRKRDPRLVCSNFVAGLVPCACPEIDEKLEEEGLPGKKRTRTQRARSGGARCQVPTCLADIRELKGYHRRHRVCLRCAHATSVVLDGESKRYCQQCGKFHILLDFDEGKRSCRRKLERHNNRRRKKPADADNDIDKNSQQEGNIEDVPSEDEDGKDILCSSSQLEKEPSLEGEDGQVSPPSSAPETQIVNYTDSVVSVVASQDTLVGGMKDETKRSLSPSCCDNRSTYSSVCPTGRISFKLYDWNPAEFPRRLRLQVLQWLSSMPVELEGYIRPGCTILTMFIAMPKSMWDKLSEDPVSYIHDFVQHECVLPARSTFFVYLNNMIYCVLKGGSSVVKVRVEDRAPKLHYIYPLCFEVGTQVEFVACGSNLLQSKFRFLISFGGKYLACESCLVTPEYISVEANDRKPDHQFYKIHIPHTQPDLFGPAFVEVENESGLSNFIPVLFGDKEVCSEMRKIQQRMCETFSTEDSNVPSSSSSSNSFTWGQTTISEFLVDIGWLLKEPPSEDLHHSLNASQIQRLTCLVNFLVDNESTVILGKILLILRKLMEELEVNTGKAASHSADIDVLKNRMQFAKEFLFQRIQRVKDHPFAEEVTVSRKITLENMNPLVQAVDQDLGTGESKGPFTSLTCADKVEAVPLLNLEGSESRTLLKRPSRQIFSPLFLRSRPALYIATTAAICFGVCAVLLHPHKVGEFAVYVHRRLFDTP